MIFYFSPVERDCCIERVAFPAIDPRYPRGQSTGFGVPNGQNVPWKGEEKRRGKRRRKRRRRWVTMKSWLLKIDQNLDED
jgi:hypothetical protein